MDIAKMNELFEKSMTDVESVIEKHGSRDGFAIGTNVGAMLAMLSMAESAMLVGDEKIRTFVRDAALVVISDMAGE
jgi:hypothetical protein